MALTGLQIQKLLPKTNCKECGANTCLAFAMKLAAKKAELSECPYASEEAKQVLGAASEPPVKTVSVGETKVGGETVLYRHEKTFVNQPIFAVNVNDTDEGAKQAIEEIKNYQLDRVGEILAVGAVAVTQKEDDATLFLNAVRLVVAAGLPVIIRAKSDAAVTEAAALIKDVGGVITGVTKANAEAMAKLAADNKLVLAVTGSSVDEIGETAAAIKEGGFNDIVLEFKPGNEAEAFQLNSIARIAALNNIKPMGYTFLRFIDDGDMYSVVKAATNEVDNYGGIVVFPKFDVAIMSTMMTLRQNIYTDPQKPIQMEPGTYKIGEPDENSYVFVTTNFSLTYFLVSGEIENSGLSSAWLVLPECEGLSVLTAWAAGKFGGDKVATFLKEQDFYKDQKNKTLIIPGYVAQISGEVQEGIPDWKVMVGSQEASDLESYVKANKLA